MTFIRAQSPAAQIAYAIVQSLQTELVEQLESVSKERQRQMGSPSQSEGFHSIDWLRAQGSFGGGNRFVALDQMDFNRSSVNISQVQYESDPTKKLASATALSTIIHPRNPYAPSMHMHISWTEMKAGDGYWRIMADLNPSIPSELDKKDFEAGLKRATGILYDQGKAQGERYFFIPALNRHRGVAHFYLEEFHTENPSADAEFAQEFAAIMTETYVSIIKRAIQNHRYIQPKDLRLQEEYHSLYFLQVLTLDRGTTSGLLVHDENDTGILASLPSHVDRDLLASWIPKLPPLQGKLLTRILGALIAGNRLVGVDDGAKMRIAKVTREFYREHPEAVDLLARGDRIPTTQANHN